MADRETISITGKRLLIIAIAAGLGSAFGLTRGATTWIILGIGAAVIAGLFLAAAVMRRRRRPQGNRY